MNLGRFSLKNPADKQPFVDSSALSAAGWGVFGFSEHMAFTDRPRSVLQGFQSTATNPCLFPCFLILSYSGTVTPLPGPDTQGKCEGEQDLGTDRRAGPLGGGDADFLGPCSASPGIFPQVMCPWGQLFSRFVKETLFRGTWVTQ